MTDIQVPDALLQENAGILQQFSDMGFDITRQTDVEFVVTLPDNEKRLALQSMLENMIPQADYKSENVDEGVDLYMLVGIVPEVELVSQIEVLMQAAANKFDGGRVAWGFFADQ